MPRYVILLRAVTPKGRNKVPMAPLRAALAAAGLRDVSTHGQSGNVLARSRRGRAGVQRLVHHAIRATTGAELAVVARTAREFRRVVARNPFRRAGADPARLHYALLQRRPAPAAARAFRALDLAPDAARLAGEVVYLRYRPRVAASPHGHAFLERRLGVPATMRNHRTATALARLAAEA